LLLAISACVAYSTEKHVMPIEMRDQLGGNPNALALQAAAGGGYINRLERVGNRCRLILKNADNMTAVMRDPLQAGMGIEMVPHLAIQTVLPRFAVVLANLTESAETTPDSFQVFTVQINKLEVAAQGQLVYNVDIMDSDVARDVSSAPLPASITSASEEIPVDITNFASNALTANDTDEAEEKRFNPKRSVPESFNQATLLIDLVESDSNADHPLSIQHMAETGELAHNIKKFMSSGTEDQVKAHGVLTIGWMLPWSLWAWICCPTFFILTPYLVPLWVFCCI